MTSRLIQAGVNGRHTAGLSTVTWQWQLLLLLLGYALVAPARAGVYSVTGAEVGMPIDTHLESWDMQAGELDPGGVLEKYGLDPQRVAKLRHR